jgi:hypothetical protein
MKTRLIRYVNFFLTGAIILMLGFKVYHINKIDFEIDLIKKQLKPIKDHIKPGSTVGFDVTTRYAASFMVMEYVMAPQVLVLNSSPDSVIIMQDKTDKLPDVKHYQIITQSIVGEKEILLILKIK